jgi:hypothetical protein
MDDQYVEWRAWQLVVEELRKVGVELNDHDRLARVLECWGEELAALRRGQSDVVVTDVRMRREAAVLVAGP